MAAESHPAVSIAALDVRFGDTTAVEHLDLEVGDGEVFGLLGPNGAGKTTTIRVLTTLLAGHVRMARQVFGVDVARRADGRAPHARLRAPAAVG